MAYIGTPPSNAFTSLLKQDFSTSATTGYTLDHAVNNANDIALFINFVRQEPTAAYSASGTTLTLTSATASSDDMYCVYLGQALQTVNPPNASVGTAQLVDDAVTKDKVSNLLYPAFEAKLSSNQTISDNTDTKVTFDTEEFDTDSAYDNSSNYRFTPQVGGKYLVYLSLGINADGDAQLQNIYAFIKKNGSIIKISHNNYTGNNSRFGTVNVVAAVTFNGSSDYIEANAQAADSSGSALIQAGAYSTFGAYRIGD